MIPFILGAAWILLSLALGVGAFFFARKYAGGTLDENLMTELTKLDQNAGEKFKAMESRVGSLESKVNLLTAFRKPGEQK